MYETISPGRYTFYYYLSLLSRDLTNYLLLFPYFYVVLVVLLCGHAAFFCCLKYISLLDTAWNITWEVVACFCFYFLPRRPTTTKKKVGAKQFMFYDSFLYKFFYVRLLLFFMIKDFKWMLVLFTIIISLYFYCLKWNRKWSKSPWSTNFTLQIFKLYFFFGLPKEIPGCLIFLIFLEWFLIQKFISEFFSSHLWSKIIFLIFFNDFWA